MEESPVRLKDRVVWMDDNGDSHLGTVRWIGRVESPVDQHKIGVEFDDPVGAGFGAVSDGPEVRDNYSLFVPSSELIRAEEFYGSKDLVPKPSGIRYPACGHSTNETNVNYEGHSLFARFNIVFNSDPFTCPICFDDIGSGDGIVLSDCLHSFCNVQTLFRKCLENHALLSDTAEVNCPHVEGGNRCIGVILERELISFMSKESYNSYLQRGLRIAEAQSPNSMHCQTPGCDYWFLVDNDADVTKIGVMVCPVCLKNNCLSCRVIHDEETCAEHKLKQMNNKDLQETEEHIKEKLRNGTAMNCPNCGIVIEKTAGCDSIVCHACKTEICWATKGPRWGKGGHGDTSGGCRCNVNGVRCHPNCQNCH